VTRSGGCAVKEKWGGRGGGGEGVKSRVWEIVRGGGGGGGVVEVSN